MGHNITEVCEGVISRSQEREEKNLLSRTGLMSLLAVNDYLDHFLNLFSLLTIIVYGWGIIKSLCFARRASHYTQYVNKANQSTCTITSTSIQIVYHKYVVASLLPRLISQAYLPGFYLTSLVPRLLSPRLISQAFISQAFISQAFIACSMKVGRTPGR